MRYVNNKRDFKSRYLKKLVKKGEEIELDRELKGIERDYLVPVEKKEKKKITEEDDE